MNTMAPQATAMPRILLLPGWLGSDAAHWQPHWVARHGDTLVEQHDWVRPRRGDWVARLEEAVLAHDGPAVLVGHSLGCHLAASWAAASRNTARVIAAMLVAPPDLNRPDLPQQLAPWVRDAAREPLPFPATLVASRDDPYAAWTASVDMAADWHAELRDAGARGHLNADSALGDWPEGRAWLAELLRRAATESTIQPH